MTGVRKITVPSEAKAALEKHGKMKFGIPVNPQLVKFIHAHIMDLRFGPTLKPTTRQMLRHFSSFGTIAGMYLLRQHTLANKKF